MPDYKQCCSKCGSEEVARIRWVNVNTNAVYKVDPSDGIEWCFGKCQNQTTIIEAEEFKGEKS